ncbi:MAG: tetratricopeptide repeat protein [Bacteroidia bacterium]
MQIKKQQNKPVAKTSQVKSSASVSRKIPGDLYDAKLVRMLGLIVAAVGAVIYLQTLSFDFALDDYSAIVENRQTKQGTAAFFEIFKSSYRFGYTIQGDELYRPLSKAVFAVIWQFSPENAFPGHLLNLLFYALTGFLLFTTLCRYLKNNIYVPFIASLLFIAHPIHSEVVANIKSLDEIFAFFFFILSLNFVHRYLEENKMRDMVIACCSFFLSLLSKESSITFILIFPLFIYFFTDFEFSKNIKTSLTILIPAIIFLIIRQQVLKGNNAGPPAVADNSLMEVAGNFGAQRATAVMIMGMYLKLLVFPHPLVFDYSFNEIPNVTLSDWKFLLSFAIYLTVGIYAVMTFKKKNLLAFAALYFFITASVSSNILLIIGTNMAERLMYAPSFGFCFAIAVLLNKFINTEAVKTTVNSIGQFFAERKILVSLVSVIVLLYAGKTIAYSSVWKDNMSLYESGITGSPNSTRTHFYLGNAICKPDYYEKFPKAEQHKIIARGIDELKKSAEIYPSFSEPWGQLGVIYYKLKNLDSAMYYYNRALQVAPYIATIHNNVGTLYFERKMYNEAITAFAKATQLDPSYSEAWCNLGSAYGTMGQLDAAIQNFLEAVKWDPNNAMANKFLGITYQNKGDALNAKIYLDKAASLGMK